MKPNGTLLRILVLTGLIVIISLMSTVTAHTEPAGWNNWAWDTSYNSIASKLIQRAKSSKSPEVLICKVTNDDNNDFGIMWDGIDYVFLNKKFVGVIMTVKGAQELAYARQAILKQYGVSDVMSYEEDCEIHTWEGKVADVIVFFLANGPQTQLWIGKKELIKIDFSTIVVQGATTPETTTKNEVILENGHFTAGVDFQPGTYTIEAIEGRGTVSSSNVFDGGINAMMGTIESNNNSGMYQQKYSNIKLPKGTILSISKVKVKMTSNDASTAVLQRRNQSITKSVTLSNGNFTAGVDFAAGTYDITAISGTGTVSTTNMFDGGINALLGAIASNADPEMYEQKYWNINLSKGVTISINRVTILLTPSK